MVNQNSQASQNAAAQSQHSKTHQTSSAQPTEVIMSKYASKEDYNRLDGPTIDST